MAAAAPTRWPAAPGNDSYIVGDDRVTIIENASEGTDSVLASVSYSLPANVENLTLTGAAAINGSGNTLDNVITGNDNNNVLDGGGGADTLIGGLGNDTYIVADPRVVVQEQANGGSDTVQASLSYTLGANLENLTLTGTANINATGNTLANVLTGNAGNNLLTGGDGNDTLVSSLGNDTLTGGAGDDVFAFALYNGQVPVAGTGVGVGSQSLITDFSVGDVLRIAGRTFIPGNTFVPALPANGNSHIVIGYAGDTTQLHIGTSSNNFTVTLAGHITAQHIAASGTDITLVNHAPAGQTTAVLAAGTEEAPYQISAATLLQGFTDADADTLSVSALTADHGTLHDNGNGSWTFTPAPLYHGAVTLGYKVVDGYGGAVAASAGFTLAAIHHAPAGQPSAVLTADPANTAYAITATTLLAGFVDVDGDLLQVSALTADHGTLASTSKGNWSFTPDHNYQGPVALHYTVDNGFGGTLAASNSFNVVFDTHLPTGQADALLPNGTEDTPYTITAAQLKQGFSDPSGDALTVSGLTATNGSLAANGNDSWTFTPDAHFHNLVTLSYSVSNTHGGTLMGALGFNVAAINHAPTGTAAAALTDGTEDQSYTVTASALLQGFSDSDGDLLRIDAISADHGQLSYNAPGPAPGSLLGSFTGVGGISASSSNPSGVSTGNWTFTPDPYYHGPVTLQYSVIDGRGGAVAAAQSFALLAVNHAPDGVPSALLADGAEDTPYRLVAADLLAGLTDADGDLLTVDGLQANHGNLSDNGDGSWTFAPDADYNGAVTLNYNVIDGHGGTLAATQGLLLASVNDAAVLGSAAVTVVETGAPVNLGGRLTISDIDSPATFAAQPSTAGKYGIFSIDSDGNWNYAANAAYTHLSAGATLTDTFQAWSADGTTTSVAVTLAGGAQASLHLGDAPARQSGSGGQWLQAWSQSGVSLLHKADAGNVAEAWSAVTLTGVSAQTLAGGDISAGNLGVSGRSANTTTLAQEIDGAEVLRITLPNAAQSVTIKLANLFSNDDGSGFSESGLLRLLDANGQEVGEQVFIADAADGSKTVTLAANSAFTAIELVAGAYDGAGVFHYGAYSNADGSIGSAIYTDTKGQMHGSDYLLASADFKVSLVGVQPALQ